MTAAAIQGSYSDFKLVKSRSQAQIVIEIPIEHAEKFIAAFGMPIPGMEKPVALALLSATVKPAPSQQAGPEKGRRRFDEMSCAEQAGIVCADKRFQQWIGLPSENAAAEQVRIWCGVNSRAEIDGNKQATSYWASLLARYRNSTGQVAEVRS